MRYTCTDQEMLARLSKKVDEVHGPGFAYSHSINETDAEHADSEKQYKRKLLKMEDLHYFVQNGRRVIVTRGEYVGPVSIPITPGLDK